MAHLEIQDTFAPYFAANDETDGRARFKPSEVMRMRLNRRSTKEIAASIETEVRDSGIGSSLTGS